MKRLSDSRIEAISLAVVRALKAEPDLEVTGQGASVRLTAAALKRIFQPDAELDRAVRARIASLSRKVEEGGREWDLLYRQYSEELARRRKS